MAFSEPDAPPVPRRFRRQSLVTYPKHMGAVVVFCSFTALALGPGLLNAYGVYEEEYDRLFDDKDETHNSSPLGSPVIFIGIIQILLANGMGFIGGQCAQRFGPGPAVFIGGILMSLGLFSASYARHIWQLCLTQGLIFGLGVCLTWIPAASAPSSWFDKNRGLATGITHMGLGIGGLVFSPLSRFLLEKAGTGGSLRWLALVMLVGVTVASLGIHSRRRMQRASEIVVSSARWSVCMEEAAQMPEMGYDSDHDIDYTEYRRRSLLSTRGRAGQEAATDKTRCSKDIDELDQRPIPEKLVNVDQQDDDDDDEEQKDSSTEQLKKVRFASSLGLNRQKTLDKLEGLSRTSTLDKRTASSTPSLQALQTSPRSTKAKQTEERLPAKPKSVLRSPRFWLLSLGVGLGQAAWYIILLFMTSISVSVGVDVSNAAIILGAINGASAVGQFMAGYAADLIGPVNSLVIFTFTATLSNALLFVPGLDFKLLIIYACLCGMSIGASDPLAVIAGVSQFGRGRAASTTGLVYGSVGMLVTITAPNARIMVERFGKGTKFGSVYFFVVALFAGSTLLLALLRLKISRNLAVKT
ncbi:hypothetical protein IWW45_003087 [Coemansia sp. RSA 485]|nr:hypothetical protein IWW45_003087 [Coemansia sp. RSA 485]KAJ2601849.1 hypothetical protein GGF39_001052 [Coemansia sp. RSA 1721]